ncbi:MAG: hypothetical protein O3A46_02680 [Candidatus Poribacteria bacterium]|nr:hypothetical protein [Candidatus Poribacteria bacterium]
MTAQTTYDKGTLLVIADLLFFAKLQAGARSLGYDAIGAGNLDIARRRLIEKEPIAVFLSMEKERFDWGAFITEVKGNEATADLPILAFGSHMVGEAFKRARELGADMVAPNSQIASEFPELLTGLLHYGR